MLACAAILTVAINAAFSVWNNARPFSKKSTLVYCLVAWVLLMGSTWTHVRALKKVSPFPQTASYLSFQDTAGGVPTALLTVEAPVLNASSPNTKYLMRLRNRDTGEVEVEIYLPQGQRIEIPVKPSTYSTSFAHGEHWFGPKILFGKDEQPSPGEGTLSVPQKGKHVQIGARR